MHAYNIMAAARARPPCGPRRAAGHQPPPDGAMSQCHGRCSHVLALLLLLQPLPLPLLLPLLPLPLLL